jgi:hypothetical protein
MKDIYLAYMAFATYLVISAERISMVINLSLVRKKGEYSYFIRFKEYAECDPITTLSGFIKSLIASTSFKNSGLETT